jgi:hypothetical protein
VVCDVQLGALTPTVFESSLPVQAIHGDASISNLLPAGKGLLWNDLEDVCVGPVEWDAAGIVASVRARGKTTVAQTSKGWNRFSRHTLFTKRSGRRSIRGGDLGSAGARGEVQDAAGDRDEHDQQEPGRVLPTVELAPSFEQVYECDRPQNDRHDAERVDPRCDCERQWHAGSLGRGGGNIGGRRGTSPRAHTPREWTGGHWAFGNDLCLKRSTKDQAAKQSAPTAPVAVSNAPAAAT